MRDDVEPDLHTWNEERLWDVVRDAALGGFRVRCLEQLASDLAPGLASFLRDELLDMDREPIGDWTHALVAAAERLCGTSDFEAGVLCPLLLGVARHRGQAQDTMRGALLAFARLAQPQLLGALHPFLDHAHPLVVQCALQCVQRVLEGHPGSALPAPLVVQALQARVQDLTRRTLAQMGPRDGEGGALAKNGFCASVMLAQAQEGLEADLSELERALIAKRWPALLQMVRKHLERLRDAMTYRGTRCERVVAVCERVRRAEAEMENP